MSPIELMHMMHPSQMAMKMTVMKKYRIGTPISLLVSAKKSAAASITSMAVFKELNPHQIASKNNNAEMAKTMPTHKYFAEPLDEEEEDEETSVVLLFFVKYSAKQKIVAPINPIWTRMTMPHAINSAKRLMK